MDLRLTISPAPATYAFDLGSARSYVLPGQNAPGGIAMEPWLVELAAGRYQAAWDIFAERYRRLILATIRRLVRDPDDVMDVFSAVCHALSRDDLARLRRYLAQPKRGARFSTWLVVVVRNLTIDWLRERDGRRQLTVPAGLSALQELIYTAVFLEGMSHIEAYEVLSARSGRSLTYAEFLRDLRETYRLAPHPPERVNRAPPPPIEEVTSLTADPAETDDAIRRLAGALAALPSDVRLAVELFVIERMSAPDVARVLGWPGPKTVYNRVYRALDSLRSTLERAGIARGDL